MRPSGMNTTPAASPGPLRMTAFTCAALVSGAALLLAGCSQGAISPSTASGPAVHGDGGNPAAPAPGTERGPAASGSNAAGSNAAGSAGSGGSASGVARLALANQSVIYTASLTIQAKNVMAAATRATAIVTAQGGYVSSEQTSASPGGHTRPTVSLQLKIPVGAYPATLGNLAGGAIGTETSLSQQAQDVTGQVADVTSQVTSGQAAITQLQALLRRAGSVSDLLTVQEQISAQESSLEALQAQARALSRETSYATVSVTLLGPQPRRHVVPVKKAGPRHGFLAGLGAGWRGLRVVVSGVLTVLGAVLPFAVVAAVLAAAGYRARRRLRRLLGLRRGSRPTPAG
jgi:Domain of unknown function (DUF4349)